MIQIFYKYMIIDGQILSHEKMGHFFTVNREFSQKEKRIQAKRKRAAGGSGSCTEQRPWTEGSITAPSSGSVSFGQRLLVQVRAELSSPIL
jgi:hypothetical protein